jgi:hypothetical protein
VTKGVLSFIYTISDVSLKIKSNKLEFTIISGGSGMDGISKQFSLILIK